MKQPMNSPPRRCIKFSPVSRDYAQRMKGLGKGLVYGTNVILYMEVCGNLMNYNHDCCPSTQGQNIEGSVGLTIKPFTSGV